MNTKPSTPPRAPRGGHRRRRGLLSQPRIGYQPTQPQLSIRIDRRRAADLGVNLNDLAQTLRATVDGFRVTDLSVGDEAIPIYLEAGAGAIRDPSDLVNLYIRTDNGGRVPLTALVTLREEGVAGQLDRQAQRRAIPPLPTMWPPGFHSKAPSIRSARSPPTPSETR